MTALKSDIYYYLYVFATSARAQGALAPLGSDEDRLRTAELGWNAGQRQLVGRILAWRFSHLRNTVFVLPWKGDPEIAEAIVYIPNYQTK